MDIDVICCRCGESIDGARDFFTLEDDGNNTLGSCEHTFCSGCFAVAVANKGCYLAMFCPSNECRYSSSSWAHYGPANSHGIRPPTIHKAKQPDGQRDRIDHPTQHYLSQPASYKKNHTLLTVTSFKGSNVSNTTTVHAEIPTNPNHITDEVKQDIGGVGKYLHNLLIQKPQNIPSSFNVHETVESLDVKTDTALRHFVHAISTGQSLSDTRQKAAPDNPSRKMYQRELNKTLVAADAMQTAKGGPQRSSALRNVITNQLFVAGANDATIATISNIGLSKSKGFMDLSADNAVIDKIQSGYDIKGSKYDQLALLYDNIGAKGKPIITNGAQIARGYIQYTTLAIKRISYRELIRWGVYPDPNHEDPPNAPCKSRAQLDWTEVQESYNFRLEEKDGLILLEQIVLPHINGILDLLVTGGIPDYEGALRWLQSSQSVEFDCNVTRRVDTRRRVEAANEDNAVEGLDYDIGTSNVNGEDLGDINDLDEHTTGGRTIFEVNGMVPDIPQQKDLNNISTVLSLSRYAHGISKRMLADEDEDMDEIWANYTEPPEPIMNLTGPALLGDGSPTFAALKLKYTKLKDTLWVVFGGFHLLLEAHKKRGGLFGMTHLRSIIHPWRPSDKQKDWIMNPGDPNQIDDESVPMYYAAYAAAALELIKSRRANGMLEDEANNITAVDVYQYTQQVEQSKPVARIILMDLRTLEVIFLLHHAEESGEAKFLVCSVKFLLLLCAFTHATKYVFSQLFKFLVNEEHNRAPSNTGDPTHALRFGKVYCETLKWFIDKDIWKLNDDNTLDSLSSNNGATRTHVNPQVLRFPSIAEERVQSYFRNYESADGSDTHGERSNHRWRQRMTCLTSW